MLSAEGTAHEDTADIEAFLSGNREAFDRLVLRHKDRIFNLCYRLLGDREEAGDCAQDTFIKAFRALHRFRLESSFSTWLCTIGVNTCKNRRKSAEFRFWKRMLRLGPPAGEDDDSLPEVEDPAPSPLAHMAGKEQEELLQGAIDSLSLDHRTVIVLRHIEGLAYEEICQITGYNPGTLKSKLARARMELQKKLQERE